MGFENNSRFICGEMKWKMNLASKINVVIY